MAHCHLSVSTALISSGSALLGSYLANRSQTKIKEIELKLQTSLKSKEMLLNVYQKRIERINQGQKDFIEQLNRRVPELKEIEKKEGTEAATLPILILVQCAFGVWRDDFFDLLKELESLGLHIEWKNQIEQLTIFFLYQKTKSQSTMRCRLILA